MSSVPSLPSILSIPSIPSISNRPNAPAQQGRSSHSTHSSPFIYSNQATAQYSALPLASAQKSTPSLSLAIPEDEQPDSLAATSARSASHNSAFPRRESSPSSYTLNATSSVDTDDNTPFSPQFTFPSKQPPVSVSRANSQKFNRNATPTSASYGLGLGLAQRIRSHSASTGPSPNNAGIERDYFGNSLREGPFNDTPDPLSPRSTSPVSGHVSLAQLPSLFRTASTASSRDTHGNLPGFVNQLASSASTSTPNRSLIEENGQNNNNNNPNNNDGISYPYQTNESLRHRSTSYSTSNSGNESVGGSVTGIVPSLNSNAPSPLTSSPSSPKRIPQRQKIKQQFKQQWSGGNNPWSLSNNNDYDQGFDNTNLDEQDKHQGRQDSDLAEIQGFPNMPKVDTNMLLDSTPQYIAAEHVYELLNGMKKALSCVATTVDEL